MIEEKTSEIRREMRILGNRIEAEDDSDLLYWVILNYLACANRSLRYHRLYVGSGHNITRDATKLLFEWARRIKELGIQSIISLMHDKDLSYCNTLDLGADNLLEFYKKQGFIVAHLPWEDPHHSKTDKREKEIKLKQIRVQSLKEYDRLVKPVLIQCSAGQDRSVPVAAYIYAKRFLEAK